MCWVASSYKKVSGIKNRLRTRERKAAYIKKGGKREEMEVRQLEMGLTMYLHFASAATYLSARHAALSYEMPPNVHVHELSKEMKGRPACS